MQKRYFFAVLLMIAVLALVPAVSAYSTPPTANETLALWKSNDAYRNNMVESFQGYFYKDYSLPTYESQASETNAFCVSKGYAGAMFHSLTRHSITGMFQDSKPSGTYTVPVTNNVYRHEVACTGGFGFTYKWWIGYNVASPIYHYHNFTITAKSLTSAVTIPRVDVSLTYNNSVNSFETWSGKTDLNGVASPSMISTLQGSTVYITASKVGYNTTSTTYTPGNSTEEVNLELFLDDAAWDTSGTKAVVYLDIIDETTNAAISGATIGIKNTTNEINPWYYNTYADSTIAFTTDGTNDLSVGQTVEFAGYKSGSYSAGNTDPISILAPVSHASLALTKSDVVDPLDIANGSFYWYPVTVVDSTTGNAISGSNLNYQVTDDLYWINKTSATGKFNMTGKGMMGLFPFENGDTITIEGNASGYIRGGFALGVDSDNSGVTQFVSLVPSSYQATTGEWTAVLLAYDDDSTAALSGVSIQLKNATSRWSKTTTSSGSATFTGLISDDSYTLTASKSGYTTATKTITGWSTGIVSVDVPMSKLSTNPTVTTTQTPLPGETSPPANDDVIAGWMRTRSIELLDFFYFFIILGSLGILLKMFNLV